ncbi:MAG: helix-turn-helix transcriptional regulator [Firmicutes bacterium]|nr:helix-turn-helix transcriptional regulator [Bacillota bacterium]
MENQKLLKLNRMIGGSYECFSFTEFLKLAILQLHELIAYDSGMFFCAISRDCSFFKPYAGGSVDRHFEKQRFPEREEYLKQKEENDAGGEALVYKALDFKQGVVAVAGEPRSSFLASQENFHVACVRIVYRGQFMGEIYLHKSKDKPDFDEEDMFVLRLLQPHISNVFHIIHAMTAVNFLETDGGRLAKKGLCLLDRELSLAGGNVTGYKMLKTPTVFGSSVLYHLKELCEDMQSDIKNGSPVLLRSGVFKTAGGNLRASVVFHSDGINKKEERFFIEMELENGEQLLADYKFKFTKREADIIDGVIQGKNNAQLAAALKLSENTIKTHIQSIYRKVGANNRTELTYILMTNQG